MEEFNVENRCQRCNRELSDPTAQFGWRCAEILGIEDIGAKFSEEYRIALENSIKKAESMMQGNNLNLSSENSKALFNALVTQSFSNSVGDYKLEEQARKESLKIITTGRTSGNQNIFNGWIKQFDFEKEDKEKKSAKRRTVEFGIEHPVIALEIGRFKSGTTNITTNAVRFATNDLGLKENTVKEGSQVNAFRHALWQATITKRYGLDIAIEVGNAHEENPNALKKKYEPEDFKNVEFKTSAEADEICDLLNNIQGRLVGVETKSEKMNKIAFDVLDKYHTDGLWISKITKNNTYEITKEKLSKKQFEEAKTRLKILDSDGYTKEQRERK